MEWQAYLREPGDTIEMPVAWMDETGLQHTVRIVVELMNQDAPRLIGIKVANRPVYLASSDIVFHSASPETSAPRRIIAANNASAEIVDELPERPPEFLKSCPFCGSADVEKCAAPFCGCKAFAFSGDTLAAETKAPRG